MLHYCCIMVTNEHEEQRRINKCNSVRGIRIEMKQRGAFPATRNGHYVVRRKSNVRCKNLAS